MHLKSLTLKGFKSFASATTMKFEPGICAVVGPNGSGKSNVVDALAWVMGEQGAKNLRGGKMQDVIFAGAGQRKPLGRAEVTLTLDNSDRRLPIDYTEVAITRRMFRDGASEYEINGSKARLMDIQELLSDSGIGREMHIIVGQGKLAEFLESRPEDRRAFIEEAAGVLKHKRRKEKAHRKLAGMQVNLDRLRDLTDELAKQLKPLARQAEAAQRAATVQATLRDARLQLAGDQVVRLRAQRDDADAVARRLELQVSELSAVLESALEAQEEAETQQEELQPQVEQAQQVWFGLSSLLERTRATLRIAQERADNARLDTTFYGQDPEELFARARLADEEAAEALESAEEAAAQLEAVKEEVELCQAAYDEAEREHVAQLQAEADRREGIVRLVTQEESQQEAVKEAAAELERVEAVYEEARSALRNAETQATQAKEQAHAVETDREVLVQEQQQAASLADAAEQRLELLRTQQRERDHAVVTLQSRIATLGEQVVSLQASEVLSQVRPLTEYLRPEPEVVLALSAALGMFAEALVSEQQTGSPTEIASALAESNRAVVVDKRQGHPWTLETDLELDWLLDHVELHHDVGGVVARLLADVVLVSDVAAGARLTSADPRLRAVTLDGVLLGEGWLVAGSAAVSGIEVAAQIEQAQHQLQTAREQAEELAGALEGARLAAQDARVAAASASAALQEHDTKAQSHAREQGYLQTQVEQRTAECEKAQQRVEAARQRLVALHQGLAQTRTRLSRVDDQLEQPVTPDTGQRDAAAQRLQVAKAAEMEALLKARSAQQQAQAVAGKGESLRRQAEHEQQAKRRHDAMVAARRAQAAVAQTVAECATVLIQRVEEALQAAVARRDELQTQQASLQARLQHTRGEVNTTRQHVSRLTDRAHAADIARSQAQVRSDEAEQKVAESLGVAVRDLLERYTPSPDFDRAKQQARLKQAEQDLRELGKVNPLALEEFKALEERYSFLSTQLADVVQAREDLLGVIADVDAHILQLFTDAWHDVEAEFPAVFQTLFPGGEARLVLTDPSDMLTTGIEIEARPPGKRVKRLSLLSGGEKSLTALAFLVAIFRARPSPFYVLDEVEAALDDVNLRRLIGLLKVLRADSQLIVITHQKATMEVANVLYGVTMRGDGVTRVLSQRMHPVDAPKV